MLRIKYCPT